MRKFISLLITSFLLRGLNSSVQDTSTDLDKKIDKIHQKILTVDSHNDTPMHLMDAGFDISKRHDPVKDHSRVDFPRMREGGEDASFFAVFVSQGKRTPEGNFAAKERADAIFGAGIAHAHQIQSKDLLAPFDAVRNLRRLVPNFRCRALFTFIVDHNRQRRAIRNLHFFQPHSRSAEAIAHLNRVFDLELARRL